MASHARRSWRTEIPSPAPNAANQRANAVAVAPGGDVLVAGTLDAVFGAVPADETFVVLALRGDDGAERWRYALRPTAPPARNAATWVAADAAGDVLAAGGITIDHDRRWAVPSPIGAGVVVKLDGATGRERWRTDPDALAWAPEAFALTSPGDVVLGGSTNDVQVALVDGGTGVVRWAYRNATPQRWTRAFAVVELPGGDVPPRVCWRMPRAAQPVARARAVGRGRAGRDQSVRGR